MSLAIRSSTPTTPTPQEATQSLKNHLNTKIAQCRAAIRETNDLIGATESKTAALSDKVNNELPDRIQQLSDELHTTNDRISAIAATTEGLSDKVNKELPDRIQQLSDKLHTTTNTSNPLSKEQIKSLIQEELLAGIPSTMVDYCSRILRSQVEVLNQQTLAQCKAFCYATIMEQCTRTQMENMTYIDTHIEILKKYIDDVVKNIANPSTIQPLKSLEKRVAKLESAASLPGSASITTTIGNPPLPTPELPSAIENRIQTTAAATLSVALSKIQQQADSADASCRETAKQAAVASIAAEIPKIDNILTAFQQNLQQQMLTFQQIMTNHVAAVAIQATQQAAASITTSIEQKNQPLHEALSSLKNEVQTVKSDLDKLGEAFQ